MIIITGVSRGIGKYLEEKYKSLNEPILGIYNATEPNTNSGNFFKLDISDISAINEWLKIVSKELNNITLINCAGINYNSFAHKANHEDWEQVIKVNVIGTFNMISSILPFMREQNYGRIINFGSVVTDIPTPGISAYSASKAAIIGLSKSISVENATKNITINTINLGYSELGMISEVPETYLNQIVERIPSKTLCKPDDIFSSVEFLRTTSYVNGSVLKVNGGMI